MQEMGRSAEEAKAAWEKVEQAITSGDNTAVQALESINAELEQTA
jgi:hypothetical protein